MDRRDFLVTAGLACSASLLPTSASSQTVEDCPAVSAQEGVPRTQDYLYRPKPQFWSFDNRDPIVSLGPFKVSFQVFVMGNDENSYGLSQAHVQVERKDRQWTVAATQFASAGQQLTHEGTLQAVLTAQDDGSFLCNIRASCPEKLRAVKVRLHRLAPAQVFKTAWNVDPNGLAITPEGMNFVYPEYQGGMPAWQLAFAQGSLGIVSSDTTPRPKRLTAYRQGATTTIDLVHEEDARHFGTTLEVPAWELRPNASLAQVIARREQILVERAGLRTWEARSDVPSWARQTKLVATLHGMHWSGYIFNDYARMQKTIEWVCGRIPGQHVVFHLAGWEGRYYRQYGDSKANDRMGGAEGLKALVQAAHARGAKVLPFYSGNYPLASLPGYEEYGPASVFHSTNGFRWDPMRGYVVDWGQLRGTGMHGGEPGLNPGAPLWRDHLIQQIADLSATYGFDGAYFDTQPSADNDSRYSALDGFRTIAQELRARRPEFLIASESWFDLSLSFVPWSQTPDGPLAWTRKYQRRFAHLSMGEPSRGSTGVHELGHIPYDRLELNRMFDIPTISFVDGTLEQAPGEVEKVIRNARALAV